MTYLATVLLTAVTLTTNPTLLHERFEQKTIPGAVGKVEASEDVVGYGGIGVENRRSARFFGETDAAVKPDQNLRLTEPKFTVEAFIKIDPQKDPYNLKHRVIASRWSEKDNQRAWALLLGPTNAVRFDVSPDGKFYRKNSLQTPFHIIMPGRWYHVAAICDGKNSYIYINGQYVTSKKREKPGIFAESTAPLLIGNAVSFSDRPTHYAGCIDEVRITKKALKPEELLKTEEEMPRAIPGDFTFKMPFNAKTKKEAVAWQTAIRKKMLEAVEKVEPRISTAEVPLDLKILSPDTEEGKLPEFIKKEQKGCTIRWATFQANARDGRRRRALLSIPDGKGPFPAMLCLHGHGGSADKVFDRRTVYHGFAADFAQRGYVVLAPSLPHRRYAPMELWDLMRCVDILSTLPEVDPERIGVAGLSMGGEWTGWIAACDTRLKVAVVSGWMCTTKGAFSVFNCPCWELPEFVDLMDVSETCLLIAPRPVVCESAQGDGCFPIEFARKGFQRIKAGYKVFGAEDAAIHDDFKGVHEWSGRKSYEAVDRALRGSSDKAKN